MVKTGGCYTPDPLRGIGSEATVHQHRDEKRNFKTRKRGEPA